MDTPNIASSAKDALIVKPGSAVCSQPTLVTSVKRSVPMRMVWSVFDAVTLSMTVSSRLFGDAIVLVVTEFAARSAAGTGVAEGLALGDAFVVALALGVVAAVVTAAGVAVAVRAAVGAG